MTHALKDGNLMISFDPKGKGQPSKSGKTAILASSHGFVWEGEILEYPTTSSGRFDGELPHPFYTHNEVI